MRVTEKLDRNREGPQRHSVRRSTERGIPIVGVRSTTRLNVSHDDHAYEQE